jgi:hypothetical protein
VLPNELPRHASFNPANYVSKAIGGKKSKKMRKSKKNKNGKSKRYITPFLI